MDQNLGKGITENVIQPFTGGDPIAPIRRIGAEARKLQSTIYIDANSPRIAELPDLVQGRIRSGGVARFSPSGQFTIVENTSQ